MLNSTFNDVFSHESSTCRLLNAFYKVLKISCVCAKAWWKQECIPVGCVPPAAVAVRGGLHQAPSRADPQSRPPTGPGNTPDEAPPDQAPPTSRPPAPGNRHRLPGSRPPPPVNRITDTCKNITFPQLRLRAVIRHKRTSLVFHVFFSHKIITHKWKMKCLEISRYQTLSTFGLYFQESLKITRFDIFLANHIISHFRMIKGFTGIGCWLIHWIWIEKNTSEKDLIQGPLQLKVILLWSQVWSQASLNGP